MKQSFRVVALLVLMSLLTYACAEKGETQLYISEWPSDQSYYMTVVNCEEWVSLREEPNTSSKIIDQISLGDRLYNCRKVSDEFTYCETDYYEGKKGYILTKYLQSPPFYVRRVGDSLDGTKILDEVADFSFVDHEDIWQIVAWNSNRIYCATGAWDNDELYMSCFDEAGNFVWGLYSDTGGYGGEITDVIAFGGGSGDHQLLYVYNTSLGLVALDASTDEAEWTVDQADVYLGTGQAHAVGWNDGTLYIGGEYSTDPVAISVAGEVLWQSDAGDDACWISDIFVEGDELLVLYDGPDGEGCIVCLDRKTGELISSKPFAAHFRKELSPFSSPFSGAFSCNSARNSRRNTRLRAAKSGRNRAAIP